jgi:hypothetical protein
MPADPAFNTSLQFYWLVDYIEAAVSCGQEAAAAALLDEVERRAAPVAVPWVRMMLSHGKALLASPARAEAFFLDGLGTIAQNWPFLRGRLLLAYGEWLRHQRRVMEARAPVRTARDILDALGALPWSDRARRELRAAGETSRPQGETRARRADAPGTANCGTRGRRTFEQGNRHTALFVPPDRRFSPVPDLSETRRHDAVRSASGVKPLSSIRHLIGAEREQSSGQSFD